MNVNSLAVAKPKIRVINVPPFSLSSTASVSAASARWTTTVPGSTTVSERRTSASSSSSPWVHCRPAVCPNLLFQGYLHTRRTEENQRCFYDRRTAHRFTEDLRLSSVTQMQIFSRVSILKSDLRYLNQKIAMRSRNSDTSLWTKLGWWNEGERKGIGRV